MGPSAEKDAGCPESEPRLMPDWFTENLLAHVRETNERVERLIAHLGESDEWKRCEQDTTTSPPNLSTTEGES